VTHEVRSISPQRLARIMAAVLGGLFVLFSLLMLPMFLFAPFPENVPNQPPKALFLIQILLYPVFGALWGWISGQITARIYNFVAARLGVIHLDLVAVSTGSE
jgi:hypothetical protein